ncbi:MAG: hypothetical protein JF571_05935 [Asticcacaulis sp.]|nr:hypothetical protein [Asticcacaulis sp.]
MKVCGRYSGRNAKRRYGDGTIAAGAIMIPIKGVGRAVPHELRSAARGGGASREFRPRKGVTGREAIIGAGEPQLVCTMGEVLDSVDVAGIPRVYWCSEAVRR